MIVYTFIDKNILGWIVTSYELYAFFNNLN